MADLKVLVVAGGTGGHFYPGLSAAKALVRKGARVHFLVRRHDAVIPLVEKDGFSYSTILAAGFQRKLSFSNILSIAKLKIGTLQSFFVLLRQKPDVILAMGGYLSMPPALIAKLFGIPVVLHEQNVKPGLANRVIGRWAAKVAVAFEESKKYFRDVLVTGNPIRPEFLALPTRDEALKRFSLDPAKKTLLVFGGSLGARRLNDYVVKALGELSALASAWQVLHITGPVDEERTRLAYGTLSFKHYVAGYCHDMSSAYAAADVVVCRAGASTVSELAVLKKPALLVPYPFASENHQWDNALVLKSARAADAHEEADLAGGKMSGILEALLRDENQRKKMISSYGELGSRHRSAAEKIAETVYGVVKTPISPK